MANVLAPCLRPKTYHTHPHGTARKYTTIWHNRPHYGIIFRSLRLPIWRFWLEVLLLQCLVLLVGMGMFRVLGGQPRTLSLDLALQSIGLSFGERACSSHVGWCRYVAAVLAFGQHLYEWVVSAVVIVRVFRGVARNRWTFDRYALLEGDELHLRFASNRPSAVVGLSFSVEAVAKPWRYIPMSLTNDGSLSVMYDVALILRHKIDATSPFASRTWRRELRGISVTVTGYDELLCEEVAVHHFIVTDDILKNSHFEDMLGKNNVRDEPPPVHGFSTFDYSKLHKTSARPFRTSSVGAPPRADELYC